MAEQLARIAQHYRFDGWLVNIENTLNVSPAGPASPCLLFPWGSPCVLTPLCVCSLLAGSSSGEPAPVPAGADGAGAQRCARGAGDLV